MKLDFNLTQIINAMLFNLKQLSVTVKRIIVGLVVLTALPLCCFGQQTLPTANGKSRYSIIAGQRVMRVFDFEERDIHFEPLPMYWHKLNSADLATFKYTPAEFPHYSNGILDTRFSRSGQYSFKLIPDGGNVAFEYDRRRIQVKLGSDFQITGYVHMENSENCRAQMTCLLTDRLGKVIPGSLYYSTLVGQNDQDETGWAELNVYMPGNYSEARYISVGLWILQEKEWNVDKKVESRVFQNNVHATAWFDDVSVFQLPRVILQTDRKSNIFEWNEQVALQVEVEGVGSLDYHVHLMVHDSLGNLIRDEAWVLTGVEGEKTLRIIDLPNLTAGVYKTKLEILSGDKNIATRYLTFAKTEKLIRETLGGKDFGVILMDNSKTDWDTSIELVRTCNAKLLKLPVWRRRPEMGGSIFSDANFDKNLINLQQNNVQVVATFSEVPDTLAMKMDIGRPSLLDVLSQDVEIWRNQVAYVLAQYARQVPYWQIGGDYDESHVWDPRISTVVQTMQNEFSKLTSDSTLAVPLDCMMEVQQHQIGTPFVALRVPAAIKPGDIPAYIQDSRDRGMKRVWTTLEPLTNPGFSREQILIDFAKRIAYAKKAGADAIFIEHPWNVRQYNARTVTEPTDVFPVFRTLADHLGGMKFVGELELAPNVPALIFERDGKGCMFAWNENYDPLSGQQPEPIQMVLGQNPTMYDVQGNNLPIQTVNNRAIFNLTDWPVIVSNINSRIAKLRSTIKLDPPVLNASISRQQMTLMFDNPFNSTISGSLRILVNDQQMRNWQIDPISMNFILQPGQSFSQTLSVRYPSNELGGKKNMEVYFNVDADRNYRFTTKVPFQILLPGVDVNIFTRKINENDLLIQKVITNDSDEEISLNSFVDLPDRDHLERAIPRLQPGMSTTKNYLIPDARQWLGGYIRIGLYDPKGTSRINYSIEIN